jgi:hypothetical protein
MFSKITCLPSRGVMRSPSRRMVMSARPPGPNGMTMRTGCCGKAGCEEAENGSASVAASSAKYQRFIKILPKGGATLLAQGRLSNTGFKNEAHGRLTKRDVRRVLAPFGSGAVA